MYWEHQKSVLSVTVLANVQVFQRNLASNANVLDLLSIEMTPNLTCWKNCLVCMLQRGSPTAIHSSIQLCCVDVCLGKFWLRSAYLCIHMQIVQVSCFDRRLANCQRHHAL